MLNNFSNLFKIKSSFDFMAKFFIIISFSLSGLFFSYSQCDAATGICLPGQVETENTRTAELADKQAKDKAATDAVSKECGGANNFNCYTLLESFGTEEGVMTTITISETGLGIYLEQIMTYMLMIVTIAAVFFMIYGGILYLTTDIVNKKAEGKEVITRVVIGLIFVFSVWTIMNSINSGLLKNSLNFSLKGIGAGIKAAVTGTPSPAGTTPTPVPIPTNPSSNTPPAGVSRVCPEGLETVQGRYQLCKTVASKMKELISAAAADGVTLTLASAYRSADSGTVSNGTTAAAGRSLHQVGLAVDFNGFKRGPATDKRFVWLLNNAGKFGFYNTLYLKRSDEYNHWSTAGK